MNGLHDRPGQPCLSHIGQALRKCPWMEGRWRDHWATAVQGAKGSLRAGMQGVPLRALQWGAKVDLPQPLGRKTKARQTPLEWQVPSNSAGGSVHLRSTCAHPQGGPLVLSALWEWCPPSLTTLLRSPPGGGISYSNWQVPCGPVTLGHATLCWLPAF